MAYSAMQIANAFIKKAQEGRLSDLTPMKLQKLMFFAQSWYLKKFRKRLIDDNFNRWRYGPVIPSIYYEFAKNGANDISVPAKNAFGEIISSHLEFDDEAFLNDIIRVYGKFSGGELSDMTHQPGTAWRMGTLGSVITSQEMFDGRV